MNLRSLVAGGLLLALPVAPVFAAAAKQLWNTSLGAEAKWHALTGLGSLLVGTDDALLGITPEDGKIAWKRTDIRKSNRHNAREIPGTPVLICNTFDGMMNTKVTFLAIDYQTGETLWTAPQILGQYLGTIPVPQKDLVIFVVNTMEGQDTGVYLKAHDLATGAAKWSTKFTKAGGIPLHLADNSGRFIPTMDLSGYHDPIVDGDEMFLGYLGVHCLDLASGQIKWGLEFAPGNKGLKKTYAPLRSTATACTVAAAAASTRSTARPARRSGRATASRTTRACSRRATTRSFPSSKSSAAGSSRVTAATSPTARPRC
jgi:outer membrane protein assembly factor BamB